MSGLCNDKLWHLGTWVCSAIWELFVYLFFFLQIFWLSRSKRNSDKKFLVQTRDWYYQSGDFHKWPFLGPIEQSVCKKYPESVEQSKKPEESILHLMKALHHKHISAVKFISITVIFSSGIELAFWICSFGGAGGKLNLKSSSNLSAAFHLPFSISKKYSYNRS